jgi:FAD/FMN-containing dehydrogenase
MNAAIDSAQVEALRAELRGAAIAPHDADYDDARQLWNGMIEKRPTLIVRCAGVADVISAVKLAGSAGLSVSVRGGGHNAAGTALGDGALAIDLSPMKGVRVDPAARTARAQGGVLLGELDRETAAFGLVTTLGIASTTGVAGLTLGGGIGYLMGKQGLACDNLISADVVTADGECLTASETQNADLFWALRGGGGNFGVVTSFEFRLHPLEPIMGGIALYPFDKARDFLRFYREFTSSAPDALEVFAGLLMGPPGTPLENQPAAFTVACHSGSEAEGQRLLQPLKAFGPPAVDMIGPLPYLAQQQLFDAAFTPGQRSYWRSYFLPEMSDAAIDTMVEACADGVPGAPGGSAVFFEHLHGAVSRVSPTATAFANRDSPYNFTIVPIWGNAAADEANIKWVRDFGDRMSRYSATGGGYVNYMAGDEGEARVRATYGVNYERLMTIKKQYDPANRFRSNQNIQPGV